MTYDEFALAVDKYMKTPFKENFEIVLGIICAIGIILFALFIFKEYKRKKAEVDTFDTSFTKDLKYPGFYPGGCPDKKNEKNNSKDGSINDEY